MILRPPPQPPTSKEPSFNHNRVYFAAGRSIDRRRNSFWGVYFKGCCLKIHSKPRLAFQHVHCIACLLPQSFSSCIFGEASGFWVWGRDMSHLFSQQSRANRNPLLCKAEFYWPLWVPGHSDRIHSIFSIHREAVWRQNHKNISSQPGEKVNESYDSRLQIFKESFTQKTEMIYFLLQKARRWLQKWQGNRFNLNKRGNILTLWTVREQTGGRFFIHEGV